MDGLTFQRPEAAWALVVAVVLFLAWRALRRPRYAALGLMPLLAAPRYRASRLRRAPAALAAAALVAIVLALMDPVRPFSEGQVQSLGLDIVIVLDLSLSMEEPMGGKADPQARRTRLDVTKRAIADLIDRRRDDRIGVIVFSENAYVISPLTIDHANLKRYVLMIDNQILRDEGLTAIGEGVILANALLARQGGAPGERNRAVVVFTDGENTFGRDPVEAVVASHDAGNRMYLIGLDLPDDIKKKAEVQKLVRTVERQGGRYFTADTTGQLSAAAASIDSLERGVLVSKRYVRNEPAYERFAAAALLLVCGALLLRSAPFFVDLT
jgi:Ca-activated chloride channel family protein